MFTWLFFSAAPQLINNLVPVRGTNLERQTEHELVLKKIFASQNNWSLKLRKKMIRRIPASTFNLRIFFQLDLPSSPASDEAEVAELLAVVGARYQKTPFDFEKNSILVKKPDFRSYLMASILANQGANSLISETVEYLLSHRHLLNQIWLQAVLLPYWENLAHAKAAQEILRFVNLQKMASWIDSPFFIDFLGDFIQPTDEPLIELFRYGALAKAVSPANKGLLQQNLQKIQQKSRLFSPSLKGND